MSAAIEKLKAVHGKLAAVTLSDGSRAILRRPTAEEHDLMLAMTSLPDEKAAAFSRYVRACYVGRLVGETFSGPESLSEVLALEGPAIISGAFGAAVNKLAGSGARQTDFF